VNFVVFAEREDVCKHWHDPRTDRRARYRKWRDHNTIQFALLLLPFSSGCISVCVAALFGSDRSAAVGGRGDISRPEPAAGVSTFSSSWAIADAFNSIDNPATSTAEAAELPARFPRHSLLDELLNTLLGEVQERGDFADVNG
jgi:hypothetical protein